MTSPYDTILNSNANGAAQVFDRLTQIAAAPAPVLDARFYEVDDRLLHTEPMFGQDGVNANGLAQLAGAAPRALAPLADADGNLVESALPGGKFYKARVTLDANNTNLPGTLQPGMVLEGDIVLGQQSILGYLLKPIHVAATSALSER